MSTDFVPAEHWTTSLIDAPNIHQWYAAPDEPVHEASADCTCSPVPSMMAESNGLLFLHQSVAPMQDTPPTPLPIGESHEELPHTFALVDATQSPQPVLQLGNQPTSAAVPAPVAPAGQAWIDVTGVTPAPQIGWLYDGQNWAPSLAEQLRDQMAQVLEDNAIYLARGQSTAQQKAQTAALTSQVSVLIQQAFLLPPPPPVGPPPPAVAQFAFTPAAPRTNATVTFDATASSGDGALSYAWTFAGSGGPATMSGPVVQRAWDKKGSNAVTLVITDESSQTAQQGQTVVVN